MMNNSKLKNLHSDKKGGGFPLLEFALAAALATGAGYMYVTHKEDIDKAAKKKITQLAKLYKQSKPEIEKRVEKVWGEVSKTTIAAYLNLRSALLHELQEENLKKQGAILKKRYEQIVESVVKSAKKSGILNPDLEKKVAELFKLDWKHMEKMLMKAVMDGVNGTAAAIQKFQASKKAKSIKKRINSVAKKMATKKSSKKKR